MASRATVAISLILIAPACNREVPGMEATSEGSPTGDTAGGAPRMDVPPPDPSTTSTTTDDGNGSSGDGPGFVYDVHKVPDTPNSDACGAPLPRVCDNDDDDDDPWHAMGLNCPGGPQVDGEYNGDPQSIHVHQGNIGTFEPPPFPPREGEKILILSSGIASDLLTPGLFASTDVTGFVDNGAMLPMPLVPMDVSATEDCVDNPNLVGTGDCSNTMEAEWTQGSGANDYNELRLTVEVPSETTGFSYDLAMFSTEYPDYYQDVFNDMYIAWLESEQWTGNVSFDEMGNPISLNAGFLDYKDAPNPYDCPAPCQAPELAGTAMMGHAGTKWLTTTAPVTPGENIELVFAVFDLSDGILDIVVLLDNWLWNCEGGPPVTVPG